MKYLKLYEQHSNKEHSSIKKSYAKLNEGGGAGKNFTFDKVEFQILLTYFNGKLNTDKKEFELGEELAIEGYQEGLRDIDVSGLFEGKLDFSIREEQLATITVAQIQYYTGNALFEDYSEDTTLLEISKEKAIDIEITGSGELQYMFGGGWLHTTVSKGDTLFNVDMDELNDGYEDLIDDVDVSGCLSKYGDLKVDLTLTATEKFEQLWKDLFERNSSYEDYLEDTDDENPMSEEDFYYHEHDDLVANYGNLKK